jgi:hypothetical protein
MIFRRKASLPGGKTAVLVSSARTFAALCLPLPKTAAFPFHGQRKHIQGIRRTKSAKGFILSKNSEKARLRRSSGHGVLHNSGTGFLQQSAQFKQFLRILPSGGKKLIFSLDF